MSELRTPPEQARPIGRPLSRRDLVMLLVVALPPVVLSLAGLAHPMVLNADTGHTWRQLHLWLLPVFPLLGLGPWMLVREEAPVVRWVVGVLCFGYAVYYTSVDVLSGIGAGSLQLAGFRPPASVLFGNGNQLAGYGVWAYLLATVLASVLALIRGGLRAVPGTILVVGGAISFMSSHIYWPRGGLTMLVLAAGWALLVLARPQQQPAASNS